MAWTAAEQSLGKVNSTQLSVDICGVQQCPKGSSRWDAPCCSTVGSLKPVGFSLACCPTAPSTVKTCKTQPIQSSENFSGDG
ncbi:hypothetical protein FVEN_g13125 [Fusarium venenatum]|nr:hypothetical protein FVEN_g13125 [Fusarium venenatum]